MSPDSPPICPIQTATSVGLPQDKVPGSSRNHTLAMALYKRYLLLYSSGTRLGVPHVFCNRSQLLGYKPH